MSEQIVSITDNVKLVFAEVMSDIESTGRMLKRSKFWLEDSQLKSVEFRISECNEWHHCDICNKFSLETCNLCYKCDTHSTWMCKSCHRGTNCPPCSIANRAGKLTYTQLLAFEQQAHAILDTFVIQK